MLGRRRLDVMRGASRLDLDGAGGGARSTWLNGGGLATGAASRGRRGVARLASAAHGEALPTRRVVVLILEENTGKRAAIPDFVGCQMDDNFGPGEVGTGQIGPWKSPGSLRDNGLPKEA